MTNNTMAYIPLFYEWKKQFKLLTQTEKGDMLDYIWEYQDTGKEPILEDRALILIWNQIKDQLDRSTEYYNDKVEAGKKGGETKAKNLKGKQATSSNSLATASNSLAKPTKENENENENENERESENSCACAQTLSPPTAQDKMILETTPEATQKFAKELFDIYEENNLPHKKGDYFAWLQIFKNTTHLRSGYHSDDILNALKNYVKVLKSSQCYYKKQLSFSEFLAQNTLSKFLPDNFRFENFLNYDEQKKYFAKNLKENAPLTQEQKEYKALLDTHPRLCTHCGTILRACTPEGDAYSCSNCGAWWALENKVWEEQQNVSEIKIIRDDILSGKHIDSA